MRPPGKSPGNFGTPGPISLSSTAAGVFAAALVYGGLVKKLVGVAYMHLYPTAGPNRLIQKAFNEGRIEIEGWTSLTLLQRLIAGAMDMECLVAKFLLGSDMARDNKSFCRNSRVLLGMNRSWS